MNVYDNFKVQTQQSRHESLSNNFVFEYPKYVYDEDLPLRSRGISNRLIQIQGCSKSNQIKPKLISEPIIWY